MTADPIDRATEVAELNLADALEAQRLRAAAAPRLAPVGYCMNPACSEDFPAGSPKLYCGASCAQAHAKISKR
jgi:hypothetical protein